MKNKIILNIVLVYFIVISIVLVSQLYLRNNDGGDTPITETVKLVDRLNNAVVLYDGSPVMLVNKRQTMIGGNRNIAPVVKNNCFYAPLSFFESAFGAVTEQDFAKRQATVRFDNTAVVFAADSHTASVISNSTDKDIELENMPYYKNGNAYIPIDAFCDVFGKEAFSYNEKMLIITPKEDNIAFDLDEETELLQDIERQVNNLPLVLSESNLKELIGVKNTIFNSPKEKDNVKDNAQKDEDVLLNNSQSEKFAYIDDYIYAVVGGKIVIIDSNETAAENAVSEIELPSGVTPESVMTYDEMLFVIGNGKNAVMPINEMHFENEEETNVEPNEKTVNGEGMLLICYDAVSRKEPVIKRWFFADGELVKKQKFDNSLCLSVRKNAFELADDNGYHAPSYCDLNKTTEVSFEEIKYLPEMRDNDFVSVFRFDMADIQRSVDTDVFLGVGNDFVLGQNYITFSASGSLPTENNVSSIKFTNLYRVNLSSGVFTRGRIDGSLTALEKTMYGYAAVVEKDKQSMFCAVNELLETDNSIELSIPELSAVSCLGDKVYLINKDKTDMLIVRLSQVYDESGGEEEPRTVILPQEKTFFELNGVEYIKTYETSAVGLGRDTESDNAEISMWALKDSAEKTSGDSIGDAGSRITPIGTKNIVDSEMAFDLSLFVKENEVSAEKYNGVYIYTISENNTPVFKGRITHNAEGETNRRITDIAYLNGKYFTLSENMLSANADDSGLSSLYSVGT